MDQVERLTSKGLKICRRLCSARGKLHLHDFYELEFVVAGSGEQNLNGTIYQLKPGSVSFLTPIDFHSLKSHGDMELVNLTFDESFLTPQMQQFFMNRRDNFFFQGDDNTTHTLRGLLDLMMHESEIEDEYSATFRTHLLDLMLYSLARMGVSNLHADTIASSSQIQQSIQYLFCHFREDISLEDVARHSGYTPNYFSKLFHDYSGEKFVDFLINLRLNYAKMLLISTDLSISVIAEKSGFGSAYNLYRRVQKAFGISPSEFREKHKNNTPK